MMARIGIAGTGFIARQLLRTLEKASDIKPSVVLSRRNRGGLHDFSWRNLVTNSLTKFVTNCDLVVECSGHPLQAATVVMAAFEKALPVVTMNTEFHVTCGSAFVGNGWLSEAEGDQPGCTAALARELKGMGFAPLVYGNMKGFLNHNPSLSEMEFWAEKQAIRIEQVTAFTDGTKIQMEQALLANGCHALILCPGMHGLPTSDRYSSAMRLAELAIDSGMTPIADYIIGRGLPRGVFVVATTNSATTIDTGIRYLLGDGPHFYFERPFHLCGMEIPKTIREALRGEPPLLNNGSRPKVGIAAIAKLKLYKGHYINRGIGSFDVRGSAVTISELPDYVPIGVLFNAYIARDVEEGAFLTWDDVVLPDSLGVDLTKQLSGI